MPKITLSKEELAECQRRAQKRLTPKIPWSLLITGSENVQRGPLYQKFLSEEVEKMKREKTPKKRRIEDCNKEYQ